MEDKIGYKKPPKKNQFKKGQSGNPKGRTPGSKSMVMVLIDELSKTITITENGKPKKVMVKEALVQNLVIKATKGDLKAVKALTDIINSTQSFIPY